MGWNQVAVKLESRLLQGIPKDAYFLFRSFLRRCAIRMKPRLRPARTEQNLPPSSNNKISTLLQFHPEKSGAPGARVLQNFLRLAA